VGTAHRVWAVVGGLVLIMGVIVTMRYLSRSATQHSGLSTQDWGRASGVAVA